MQCSQPLDRDRFAARIVDHHVRRYLIARSLLRFVRQTLESPSARKRDSATLTDGPFFSEADAPRLFAVLPFDAESVLHIANQPAA